MILDRKNELILGAKTFILDFLISKFSENPAYATDDDVTIVTRMEK